MSISAISGGMSALSGVGQSASITGPASTQVTAPKSNFEDQLSSMLQGVDEAQQSGDVALQDLAAGDAGIHETMIALTQADITLQAATTARNKVVSAYETIMNMAI